MNHFKGNLNLIAAPALFSVRSERNTHTPPVKYKGVMFGVGQAKSKSNTVLMNQVKYKPRS